MMNWFQRLFGNSYDWVGVRTPIQLYKVPVSDAFHPREIRDIDPRILLKVDEIPTELLYWTPDSVARWMHQEFTFASDAEQYQVADHWESPAELMLRKKGDCDAWAIFFTSFLLLAGYKARFCGGVQITRGNHAWVLCDRQDKVYLFDPLSNFTEWRTAKSFSGYIPQYSFDRTYFYRHLGKSTW